MKLSDILKDENGKQIAYGIFSLIASASYVCYHVYFVFQTHAFWFLTMAAYYLIFLILRIYTFKVMRNIRTMKENDRLAKEYLVLHQTGWLMLVLNITLVGTIILIMKNQYVLLYDQIMMIAIAAYTFYKFFTIILDTIRMRRDRSPLNISLRSITFIDGLTTFIGFQAAMISAFSENGSPHFLHISTFLTGTVVVFLTFIISLKMILTKPETAPVK